MKSVVESFLFKDKLVQRPKTAWGGGVQEVRKEWTSSAGKAAQSY